jgi:putative DNA primase/helicase
MLSVVGRCAHGERLAHKLSAPYPNYSETETAKKLEHALTAAGPITCERVIEKFGPEYCGTCAHLGKVTSPIVLGTPRAAASAIDNSDWADPRPVTNRLPDVPEFDPGLLPADFRAHAEDVSERMQVPLDFAGAALTVALAGIVGRRASITPKRYDDSFVVTPNLYGGIVSRPGFMKSPLIAEVFRPLHRMQVEKMEEHREAMREYERELEAYQMRKAVWKEKAKKGGLVPVFNEDAPEEPRCVRYIAQDATIEKMHAILVDNPAGVLLVRDELAGWLQSLDTKGRERDRPFYLEAWNGDHPYTFDRIGRGTLRLEHLCLSVFGSIQPAKLRSYLTNAVNGGAGDDGLAQRLQLLVWPDHKAEWKNVDRKPNTSAATAVEEVFRRVADMPGDEPFPMRFSPDAQELFNAWRDELEPRVRSGKLPPYLESHLAKYRSLMPTLALLLHIADGGEGSEVPLIHTQRAADYCDYLEAHAKRAYSCVSAPEQDAAVALSKKIKEGAVGRKFTVRDVYTKGWANLVRAEQVRAALTVLEQAGWVRREDRGPGEAGGRPTEEFIVNPRVFHE